MVEHESGAPREVVRSPEQQAGEAWLTYHEPLVEAFSRHDAATATAWVEHTIHYLDQQLNAQGKVGSHRTYFAPLLRAIGTHDEAAFRSWLAETVAKIEADYADHRVSRTTAPTLAAFLAPPTTTLDPNRAIQSSHPDTHAENRNLDSRQTDSRFEEKGTKGGDLPLTLEQYSAAFRQCLIDGDLRAAANLKLKNYLRLMELDDANLPRLRALSHEYDSVEWEQEYPPDPDNPKNHLTYDQYLKFRSIVDDFARKVGKAVDSLNDQIFRAGGSYENKDMMSRQRWVYSTDSLIAALQITPTREWVAELQDRANSLAQHLGITAPDLSECYSDAVSTDVDVQP
jgi:hypothetical protein